MRRRETRREQNNFGHESLYLHRLCFCIDVTWMSFHGLFFHSSWCMKCFEVGNLMPRGCFYFDDKEEEWDIKIWKGKNWLDWIWCSLQRGSREEDRYGATKEKEALWIFQDLFFYSYILQFLLNCGILAFCQWVYQSFCHTADCFIAKWVKQANFKIKRKKRRRAMYGKKKERWPGQMYTEMEWGSRWRDRNRATEICWYGEIWAMSIKQYCYHNKQIVSMIFSFSQCN